jgi:hypothetical protein
VLEAARRTSRGTPRSGRIPRILGLLASGTRVEWMRQSGLTRHRGRAYVVFLTGAGAVLALRGGAPDDEGGAGTTSVVRVQVAGTAGPAKAIGSNELPGKANYFIGNADRRDVGTRSAHSGVPRRRRVRPGAAEWSDRARRRWKVFIPRAAGGPPPESGSGWTPVRCDRDRRRSRRDSRVGIRRDQRAARSAWPLLTKIRLKPCARRFEAELR